MTDPLVDGLLKGSRPGAGDPLVQSLLSGSNRIPSPPKTRSQSIAEQVGQPDLPKGGMKNLPARVLIEAADTKLEKLAAFKKFYPNGELAFIPLPSAEGRAGDPVLVFREDPSQPYSEVDAPFLDSLGDGGELLSDFVEFFANDFGTILGESLTAVGSKPIPQGKLLFKALQLVPQLVKLAAGAFGGELAQEAAERAIIPGESDESVKAVVRRAQGQAAMGAFGGVVLDKLGRPVVNLVRGAGVVGLRTGAQRAMQAAERLGLKQLPATMVSDSPILQRMGRQAAALTTTLNRYVEGLESATFRAAQKLRRSVKDDSVSIQSVINAEAAERADVMRILTNTKGSVKEAGEAVQQAVADYELSSQGRVSMLYAAAKEVERPKFDVTSAIDEAKKVNLIAEGLGPEGAGLKKLTNDILNLVDENGNIPTRSVELSDGSIFELDATEQIRFLRTRAFGDKIPPVGQIAKAPEKLSGQLFNALGRVLDNPVGGSGKFKELYSRANKAARERFSTLENSVLIEATKTDTPSALAARLIDFGNAANIDNIRAVRQVMPVDKFAKVQAAATAELIKDPFQLSQKLRSAKREALSAMFSPDEIAALGSAARMFDDLAKTGLPKVIEGQSRVGALVADLVQNKQSAGVTTLVEVMERQGGKDSPLGRTIRSGIIDTVIGRAGVFERGVDRIDFQKLRAAISDIASFGGLRFLKKDDLRGLNDLLRVQDLLRLTPDAGTSLQAAEAVAGLRNPTTAVAALTTIFENFGVGRLVTTPGGINFLVGKAGKQKTGSSAVVKTVGAIGAQLLSDAEATGQTIEDLITAAGEFADRKISGAE